MHDTVLARAAMKVNSSVEFAAGAKCAQIMRSAVGGLE